MARQKGLFKVTGTLGDVNFYVIKGVGYARKAGGGFNGEAIRNHENMHRVRENANEFGKCSSVKKSFRLALMPFLKGYKQAKLHARMMSLFTSIKALDAVSDLGNRTVSKGLNTVKGRRLLRSFEITPKHNMLQAVLEHSTFNWSLQQLRISRLDISHYPYPKTATHVGLTLGVLDFNFDNLNASLTTSSTYFMELSDTSTSFNIGTDTVSIPEFVGIAILRLQFYEIIEGEAYGLNNMIGVGFLDVREFY